MKLTRLALFLAVAVVSACSQPTIVVTNQATGVSGKGTATGATFSSAGDITFTVEGETYTGPWVAMRDPGHAYLTFWSMGPKDSGVGIANLTSPSGKYLRCEFGYNLSSLSGIGLCKSKKGNQTYDFMLSM